MRRAIEPTWSTPAINSNQFFDGGVLTVSSTSAPVTTYTAAALGMT